jgi:quercetin dioxygenase-like cupin family protein
MYFHRNAERDTKELVPGGLTRTFWGEKLLVSYVTFGPNVAVPSHSHPHEQTGVVLSGELTMTIGAETRTMTPGDFYIVPGGVLHSAVAGPEGFIAYEVFSPVREDLKY